MNDLVMKINGGAPCYVFTLQARAADDDTVGQELTLAQVETARNAAVAVLNAIGIEVDSTSSVVGIDAPEVASRLVLTPTVEPIDASAPALDPGIRL